MIKLSYCTKVTAYSCRCEERSDEAIYPSIDRQLDCHVAPSTSLGAPRNDNNGYFLPIRSLSTVLGCCLSLILFSLIIPISAVYAQLELGTNEGATADTEGGDVETLLKEAQELFIGGRPIDARAKLQKALRLAPEDYRIHMWLGEYYLIEVGNFRLADRYLKTAKKHFDKDFDPDKDLEPGSTKWREQAQLLRLLSEARLNLDDYEGALEYLDKFGETYWGAWYPGSKAWVLMKLKRVDEAISVAQAGLVRGADGDRTYNILGILLSLKGNRELSLQAFARAIQAELNVQAGSQVATPLNNSGEVYSELFRDGEAEAAWRMALRLPDGCEHILPSLNLAKLYIDQLRLFQAERVLDDFIACYSSESIRTDTEHRSLIALGRGRIALRVGDVDQAVAHLETAHGRRQWYGKIGTTQDDLRFAAMVTLAQGLNAKAASLEDTYRDSTLESLQDRADIYWLKLRSWWLNRRARELALDELSDLEDLFIRNTDAMVQYATLGGALSGFSRGAFRRRIAHMSETDSRTMAQVFYNLYLGTNLLENGDPEYALDFLEAARNDARLIDRLLEAEAIAKIILAKQSSRSWWSDPTEEEARLSEELFLLLPSHVRYHNLSLPVKVATSSEFDWDSEIVESIVGGLTARRFHRANIDSPRFSLLVAERKGVGNTLTIGIELQDNSSGRVLVRTNSTINLENPERAEVINSFISKTFRHTVDPAGEPLPKLDILSQGMQGL